MERNRCRGCRAEIVWCVTKHGKPQPLDATPQKRIIQPPLEPAEGAIKLVVVTYDASSGVHRGIVMDTWPVGTVGREVDAYMPHHAVCPKVGQFRSRR